MANFSTLIAEIEAYIKTNGEQEITGQILQNVLKDIVDTLGNGAVFKGIATTDGTPGTPDNNVFYFAALAGTYTNYGGAVLDGNTLHILAYNGSWTDVDTGVPSATAAATFAKIDGYYASLTAGAAENLVGRGSVPASFLRRTTGGTADVGTGSAKITKLMGNSIVWNQIIKDTQLYDWSAKSHTLTGHTFNIVSNAQGNAYLGLSNIIIIGHKYLLIAEYKTANAGSFVSFSGFMENIIADNTWRKYTRMTTGTNTAFRVGLRFSTVQEDLTGEVRNIIVFDLTKIFGEGKEPSTVAEFEALFPLDYYDYNAGEVLPFATEKLVTTGFNQWDEVGEVGNIVSTTGENAESTSGTNWRSVNYIKVFAGQTYYCKSDVEAYSRFYDANKNYLGNIVGNIANTTFVIPANAAYMRFVTSELPTAPICINLSWSGYRNGEYEPYELHELVMDPANWEDADGNKIFPYGGMHGVGAARDFATPDNDGFIRKATRIWDRRAYEEGDESDASVITDGSTYTFVKLAEPVEKELAEPVAASYYANDFGTEEWQPANTDVPYTAPCELAIAYAMNAVDTLRRLPENYISAASFENFCTELASKLGAALNKSITIAATYDAEEEEYDYAITIEDIEEG